MSVQAPFLRQYQWLTSVATAMPPEFYPFVAERQGPTTLTITPRTNRTDFAWTTASGAVALAIVHMSPGPIPGRHSTPNKLALETKPVHGAGRTYPEQTIERDYRGM